MVDRKSLRLSATLLIVSQLVGIVAVLLHPVEPLGPNDNASSFTVYAAASNYTGVHVLGFLGWAAMLAALIVLFFALSVSEGAPRWAGMFGAISAGVALVLNAVLQAVDGVALKQAADAWVSVPTVEKAARFASAESLRWLEWAFRSYQGFMIGLALVLLALVIVWTARVPRPIGYLMGLSGLAFFVHGWLIGAEGFSPRGAAPVYAYELLVPLWILWLSIVAWRRSQPAAASAPMTPTPAS